jgi:hypothetical protein
MGEGTEKAGKGQGRGGKKSGPCGRSAPEACFAKADRKEAARHPRNGNSKPGWSDRLTLTAFGLAGVA